MAIGVKNLEVKLQCEAQQKLDEYYFFKHSALKLLRS